MSFVGVSRHPARPTLIAGFLGILALACVTLHPPTDTELVSQFTRDSASYYRVIAMFRADRNIGTIAPNFLWSVDQVTGNSSAGAVGITEARLAEYRRILNHLGVIRLDRWGPYGVMFATWAAGFAGNTHHRGIAWLVQPRDSIGWRRFHVIVAPWYMFED